ncbi:30S ribosomal protein S9 [Candidatus Bathyarchaeota archaeon]|nr:MAG: 30S ribosomal protein S9 [Candidatus Hecatellales archaeon ex4484_218]RJX16055.1 MAG: 30S ribosomal protein S9 [Candidatus Bathyarchaeota archaeon]
MPARKLALIATGKRKTAIARAVIRPGNGNIRINNIPLEVYQPEVAKWKIMEPLMLAGDLWKQVDIDVNVKGGGFMGQAEAVRMSIARGLVTWFKSSKLKKLFISYDRSMIAGDPRRKEMKKFGGPGARRRRQKSYR